MLKVGREISQATQDKKISTLPSKALFARTNENSIAYFKLIAADEDHKYREFCDAALDEYYDTVYDKAMDEYYDVLYDGAMDDLYDEYYDGFVFFEGCFLQPIRGLWLFRRQEPMERSRTTNNNTLVIHLIYGEYY